MTRTGRASQQPGARRRGEILLSPIGLALITRLAPPQRTSQMLGLWFAATAIGNWLAGGTGLLWNRWPHHRYFGVLALLALGAAGLLLSKMRRLERLLAAQTIPAAGAPSKS